MRRCATPFCSSCKRVPYKQLLKLGCGAINVRCISFGAPAACKLLPVALDDMEPLILVLSHLSLVAKLCICKNAARRPPRRGRSVSGRRRKVVSWVGPQAFGLWRGGRGPPVEPLNAPVAAEVKYLTVVLAISGREVSVNKYSIFSLD